MLILEHYGITDRIVAGLDELGDDTKIYLERKTQELQNTASKAVESVIDYAIDSAQITVVNIVNSYLRKFTLHLPRI